MMSKATLPGRKRPRPSLQDSIPATWPHTGEKGSAAQVRNRKRKFFFPGGDVITPQRRRDAFAAALLAQPPSLASIPLPANDSIVSDGGYRGVLTAERVIGELSCLVPLLPYGEERSLLPSLIHFFLRRSDGPDRRKGDITSSTPVATSADDVAKSIISADRTGDPTGLLAALARYRLRVPWSVRFRLCLRVLTDWNSLLKRGEHWLVYQPQKANVESGINSRDSYRPSVKGIVSEDDTAEIGNDLRFALSAVLDGIYSDLRLALPLCSSNFSGENTFNETYEASLPSSQIQRFGTYQNDDAGSKSSTAVCINDWLLRNWFRRVPCRANIVTDLARSAIHSDIYSLRYQMDNKQASGKGLIRKENWDRIDRIVESIDELALIFISKDSGVNRGKSEVTPLDFNSKTKVSWQQGVQMLACLPASPSKLSSPLKVCRSYLSGINVQRRKKLVPSLDDRGNVGWNPELDGVLNVGKGRNYSVEIISRSSNHSDAYPSLVPSAQISDQECNDSRYSLSHPLSRQLGRFEHTEGGRLIASEAYNAAVTYSSSTSGRGRIKTKIKNILQEMSLKHHFNTGCKDTDSCADITDKATASEGTTKAGEEYLTQILFSLLNKDTTKENLSAVKREENTSKREESPSLTKQSFAGESMEVEEEEEHYKRGSALLVSFLLHNRVDGYDQAASVLLPSPIRKHLGLDFYVADPSELSIAAQSSRVKARSFSSCAVASSLLCRISPSSLSKKNNPDSPVSDDSLVLSPLQVASHNWVSSGSSPLGEPVPKVSELGLEVCLRIFLHCSRGRGSPIPRPRIFRGYGPLYSGCHESVPDVRGLAVDLFDLVIYLAGNNGDESASAILRVLSKYASWLPMEPISQRFQILLYCVWDVLIPDNDQAFLPEVDYDCNSFVKKFVSCLLSSVPIGLMGRIIMYAASFYQVLQSCHDQQNNRLTSSWGLVFTEEFCQAAILPLSFRCDLLFDLEVQRGYTTDIDLCRGAVAAKMIMHSILVFIQQAREDFERNSNWNTEPNEQCHKFPCAMAGPCSLGDCTALEWAIDCLADFHPSNLREAIGQDDKELTRIFNQYCSITTRLNGIHREIWGKSDQIIAASRNSKDARRKIFPQNNVRLTKQDLLYGGQISILMPPFCYYVHCVIHFAMTSKFANRRAEQWCRHVTNVVMRRYLEASNSLCCCHKLMRVWGRNLVDILLNDDKEVVVKFTPLLTNLHKHLMSCLQNSIENHQISVCCKEVHGFAFVLLHLSQDSQGVDKTESNRFNNTKDPEKKIATHNDTSHQSDKMSALMEILRNTPPSSLFISGPLKEMEIKHQDITVVADQLLHKVSSFNMRLMAPLFVGLGIYVHVHCSELGISSRHGQAIAPHSGFSDKLSQVVTEHLLILDTKDGKTCNYGRHCENIGWELLLLTVRGELEQCSAFYGITWWDAIVLNFLSLVNERAGEKSREQSPVSTWPLEIQHVSAATQMLEDDLSGLWRSDSKLFPHSKHSSTSHGPTVAGYKIYPSQSPGIPSLNKHFF